MISTYLIGWIAILGLLLLAWRLSSKFLDMERRFKEAAATRDKFYFEIERLESVNHGLCARLREREHCPPAPYRTWRSVMQHQPAVRLALAERQFQYDLERREAEMNLRFKSAALEKMLHTLDPAMLLGMKKEEKPETYIVPISAGGPFQVAVSPIGNDSVTVVFTSCRNYDGTGRIVDIKLPENTHVVQLRFGDMAICEGVSAATLMKHCASICREKTMRLYAVMPLFITLRAGPGLQSIYPLAEILKRYPIEIMVEIEKPKQIEDSHTCGCGRSVTPGYQRCDECMRTRTYTPKWHAFGDHGVDPAPPVTEGSYRGGMSDAPVSRYDTPITCLKCGTVIAGHGVLITGEPWLSDGLCTMCSTSGR